MEYIVFAICILIFISAIIAKDIYNDRKKQKEFRQSLISNYGKGKRKEYKLERFARIDKYFQRHREKDQIDDITWNDLGMDEIFKEIDQTHSSAGEEYLYYCLRTPGNTIEQLAEFEELIKYYHEHEDERLSVQLLMAKLGYMGKYSLYDYLDNLDYLGERSNRRAWIFDGLLIAAFFVIPFNVSAGILASVFLMLVNIVTYFHEKSEIEPYIISFSFILKLITSAEKFERLKGGEVIQKAIGRTKALRTELQKLQRGSFWVTSGNGSIGDSNPATLLFDYLKMIFHLDLIRFNQMLAFLRKNVDKVDELNTILGRQETAISIGSWRAWLEQKNGYCIPGLWEGKATGLVMEEGYHPLLSEPVKNTLNADRGILLTGSNASGKSTFLKTVAINSIFAQTIHTCNAKSFSSPFFRIYSSMSLRDDIEGGDSYYIVEIKALKRILNAAGEDGRPVLCFVDEVLRGTNTVERIAASTQVLKSLCGDRVLCCAATHDVELTELLGREYDNYHFEEEIRDGDVYFQYRLLSGKASTRNAIKLLEIIGYDEKIVKEAQNMAQAFVDTGRWS